MTIKEEVEQLRKEIKHLKKAVQEQNLALASIASAIIAFINLLVISFKK